MSSSNVTSQQVKDIELPTAKTMGHAMRYAIADDRPIMMDYWLDSLHGKVVIGVKEDTKEKLLVKSEDEYTSNISNIYKSDDAYVILTENSVYVTKSSISMKKITS